jgi:hypothetical protein
MIYEKKETFIMYAQGQKLGQPNNLNIFGGNKP